MRKICIGLALVITAALVATTVSAKEYPIGATRTEGGMEINPVYLQAVQMDPPGMMRAAKDSDIHLEADIRAASGNKNGFPEGEWIPYLNISYILVKSGSNQKISGHLMPMVANDGPHYGDNVKLAGVGKYHLTLIVSPPATTGHVAFGRHIDRETGVAPWFKPFQLDYDFIFAGVGKKGGY